MKVKIYLIVLFAALLFSGCAATGMRGPGPIEPVMPPIYNNNETEDFSEFEKIFAGLAAEQGQTVETGEDYQEEESEPEQFTPKDDSPGYGGYQTDGSIIFNPWKPKSNSVRIGMLEDAKTAENKHTTHITFGSNSAQLDANAKNELNFALSAYGNHRIATIAGSSSAGRDLSEERVNSAREYIRAQGRNDLLISTLFYKHGSTTKYNPNPRHRDNQCVVITWLPR